MFYKPLRDSGISSVGRKYFHVGELDKIQGRKVVSLLFLQREFLPPSLALVSPFRIGHQQPPLAHWLPPHGPPQRLLSLPVSPQRPNVSSSSQGLLGEAEDLPGLESQRPGSGLRTPSAWPRVLCVRSAWGQSPQPRQGLCHPSRSLGGRPFLLWR